MGKEERYRWKEREREREREEMKDINKSYWDKVMRYDYIRENAKNTYLSTDIMI